MLGSRELRT